jgi:hypothetical protein
MRKMRRKGEMDWKELMSWAFVLILVVTAIAVPVGIHLSNNNKKSVPTNTPEPGGTGPPVPPIVPPQPGQPPPVQPLAPPQSGQPPPVPPLAPPPLAPPPLAPQPGQASIVPPSIAPQSGQASLVPPLAPPSVQRKIKYEQQGPDDNLTYGCALPNGKHASVNPVQRTELEDECSLRDDCAGYYEAPGWLISTYILPKDCGNRSSVKYPYFNKKIVTEG